MQRAHQRERKQAPWVSRFQLDGARRDGSEKRLSVTLALLSVGGGLLAIVIAAATVVAATENPAYGLAIVGLVAVATWFIIPAKNGSTPKWLRLFLLALVFGTVLPTQLSFLVQASAVVGAYVAWLRTPTAERRGKAAVGWVTAILIFWAVLAVHPNVPSVEVGIIGFRKTVFCLAGVVAGAAIDRKLLAVVELTAVRVLAIAVAVSILVHQFAPGIEQSITRDANEYTGLLGGESRMQGIFSGPFHATTACLIIAVWGIARFGTYRRLGPALVALGLIGMYLTLVRTAYVALGLAIIAIIICAPTAGKVVQRLAGTLLVGFFGVLLLSIWNPAVFDVVDSIMGFSTDTRFLGRFPGYAEGIDLIASSPIFGWGAGSAGDTLDPYFTGGHHITSHNIALKVLVEGGLIGAFLWVGLIVASLRAQHRRSPNTALAAGVVAVLLGMGITGSSLETLPLTWFIFLFVGMSLDPEKQTDQFVTSPKRIRSRRVVASPHGGNKRIVGSVYRQN
jgi:O-antigen ligase